MIDMKELLGVENLYQWITIRGGVGVNRGYGEIFPEVE
jgi:hypothetical protein